MRGPGAARPTAGAAPLGPSGPPPGRFELGRRVADEPSMSLRLQQMFREYAHLDRKRTTSGVTPQEYQRWLALKAQLARTFSKGPPGGGAERRDLIRVPTRMKVSFQTNEGVARAVMTNLSRGGLFINTAFPAPLGTRLELALRIDSTGEELHIPAEVVSQNVGGGYDTQNLGMGVRFLALTPPVRKKIDEIYAAAGSLEQEGEDAPEESGQPEDAASPGPGDERPSSESQG